jgi:integrase
MRRLEDEPEQLYFDGMGGVDMQALKAARDELASVEKAPLTRKALEHDWKLFSRWCGDVGRDALPATEDTVGVYVSVMEKAGLAQATMYRRVCSISSWHKAAGLATPVIRGGQVWKLIGNVPRLRAEQGRQNESRAKQALSTDELRAISRKLASEKSRMSARDRALMVFGLASAMRRSELSALDLSDVQVGKKGITVNIRKSKRDQEAKGRLISISPGRRAASCPLRTLKAWIRARGRWPGPLFCRIEPRKGTLIRKRLGTDGINNVIKRSVGLIGLDRRQYGGHSLRAGMVTAALDAGVSPLAIMRRTGHKAVQMVARYDRPKPFSFDPLAKAM